ncbi:hypothetical protein, partial [Dokdonella fugitiva]|uniref:hypothetical protein n=1 Tax=Dokdonella fugitiva TaxID=328517 RepID=UPI001A7E154F
RRDFGNFAPGFDAGSANRASGMGRRGLIQTFPQELEPPRIPGRFNQAACLNDIGTNTTMNYRGGRNHAGFML